MQLHRLSRSPSHLDINPDLNVRLEYKVRCIWLRLLPTFAGALRQKTRVSLDKTLTNYIS